MNFRINLAITLFLLIIYGCNSIDTSINDLKRDRMINFKDLSSLSSKKVYFAHRSVGSNIIEGIDSLVKKNEELSFIEIVTLDDYLKMNYQEDDSSFYFVHSPIGKNGFPETKIDDFENKIDSIKNIDAAFLKFCYFDINRNTDINQLYNNYAESVENLQKKYDSIKFVYFTSPLTLKRSLFNRVAKSIIGKPDDNINRNKFNDLLRETVNLNLFDIAYYESHPEGGSKVPKREYLLLEYSSDGRHLNQTGSEKIALHLLVYLNNLLK